MPANINKDYGTGRVLPGVYVSANLNAPGGGPGGNDKRMLIAAYMASTGTKPPDTPFQPLSEDDVNSWFGQRSDMANGYRAALAEGVAGDIDIWCVGLTAPSGGTAATYKLIFAGTATADDTVEVSIGGWDIQAVGIANGDTSDTVAANVKAAIDLLKNTATAGIASSTITLTYPHKGDVGEDFPIRLRFVKGGSGITCSFGSIVFATNVTTNGSALIKMGATSITVSIADGDTPAQVATKVVTAINAGAYPFTAAIGGTSATVDLFSAEGRDIRHYTVTIVTSTGITATVTTQGSIGAGSPTLTTALANIKAVAAFKTWAVPFVGSPLSPDLTTLGTISSHIEVEGNGVNMKDQAVHACAVGTIANAGTIPTGTSPALTASPRYVVHIISDLGVPGFWAACRTAALRCANDEPRQNWNGTQLHSSTRAPLKLPAVSSRPTPDQLDTAIRAYNLCPLAVNDLNQIVIVSGITTSNDSYMPLHKWSCIDQVGYWRRQVRQDFRRFAQASSVRLTTPKQADIIDGDSIKDALGRLMNKWEGEGRYDGAEVLRDQVRASFNGSNPHRIDASFPMSPVLDLDGIGVVGNLVAPGQ